MKTTVRKFSEFEYRRPDPQAVTDAMDRIVLRINTAERYADVKEAFEEYHAVSGDFFNATNIAYIRHTINTKDEFYKEENDFADKYTPVVTERGLEVARALLSSSFREELYTEYGKHLFDILDNAVKSIAPEIIPLMQEENALCSRYNQIYASAQIPFQGETYTLAQLRPFKASPDRNVRKAAYIAEGDFFEFHGRELDELFDKLVENRTAQARKMGFKDYTELGNIRMGRIGYTKRELENFRRQVIDELVPDAREIIENRKKRIGVEDWKGYDSILFFREGNPAPKGTPEEILEAGRRMYHELSGETSEFIDEMLERELFDVLSRDGKAGGGYCSYIEKHKCCFIFANFNGTSSDVDVLTHEAGHAFAGFVSYGKNLIPEYFSPQAEGCEVHSIAMEYLTQDFHELFFKEDTAGYQLMHKESAIIFIPSACLADEFQYRVYENPHWTAQERHQEWKRLERIYQPHLSDFEDIPFYSRGARWQSIMHIMVLPFYYIDYALAQTVAMQLWGKYLEDKKAAWEKYLAFVEQAGTKAFAQLVTGVDLKSPFEDGYIRSIKAPAMEWIRKHQN